MSRQRDASQFFRNRRVLASVGVPVLAVVAALVFGAILIAALGANPLRGYASLVSGAFGGTDELSRTIVRAVPLMLVGAGICLAFRASVINIGGEGQMVMGGLLATATALAIPESLSRVLALPAVLVAGTVGGFAYGALPGALKARFNVNEILSTIMLNIVAVQFMNFLLQGTLQDRSADNTLSNIPQSRRLPRNTDLPLLPGGSQLNVGFIVAVVAAVIAWVILWRTVLGYRLRAVGFSPDAARYAGMSVKGNVTLALAISGAFCGLAGAVVVLGSDSHRMFTDGTSTGFTGSAGFNGIIAALFGGLHPLLTLPSSVLFGALLVGANQMQRDIQVPAALITALNGLIVVFVVSSTRFRHRLLRSTDRAMAAAADATQAEVVGDVGGQVK